MLSSINSVRDVLSNINELLWGPPFILLLVITSLYLSFKFKFPQLKIILSIKELFKGRNNNLDKMTSFKTLMTILAGTLGTGNITGIAVAITIGGVGSLFWMCISAILVMVISYVENYIVLMYRKKDRTGYFGGTMYVLDEVLDKKYLAIIFSVILVFAALGSGTMTQSNSLSTLLHIKTGVDKSIIGIILALITAYIVFGGKKRIAKASSIVIPICTIVYIVLCALVICLNKEGILPGLKQIVISAFGIKEVTGGIAGLSIKKIISQGFSIGMFSNEAGMGSAPIFTATVDENTIDKEAKIAATSVVIDTIILCMLTGITIVASGTYNYSNSAEMLTATFGIFPLGSLLLNICMVFFVIATIPCWEYYGEQGVKYLTKSNLLVYVFRILYIIGIYVGSVIYSGIVWDLASIANALMVLPNMYMIYKCVDDVKHNIKKQI